MKKIPLLLILAMLFANAAVTAQPSRFSAERFIGEKGDTLNYRLLFPDAAPGRKFPLVIFLHGAGERGSDNDAQLKWGAMSFATDEMMSTYPAFVVAPQCPLGMTWSNVTRTNNNRLMTLQPEPSKPMALLYGLLQKMKQNPSVDTNRIYITGVSMGGYGTFDALERYPNVFAAAMPVCGGGDTARAASIAHIPMWIVHGSEDATVTPLNSIDMVQALMKAGARPGFSMYPETGHFSWLAAYSNRLAFEWLFRQRKQ